MTDIPPEISCGRKLLRAVAELHVRGHQKLRIVPYIGSTGNWRCLVVPIDYIQYAHGARLSPTAQATEYDDPEFGCETGSQERRVVKAAKYSSADGGNFWQTLGAAYLSASQLAKRFLAVYPELARVGYGQDWTYAGWYQHMLHVTHPDALPIACGWDSARDEPYPEDHLLTIGRALQVPLPPPGVCPE